MIRRLDFRIALAAWLALAGAGHAQAQANRLKLLLTLESPSITYPFPARATLHLVNGGSKPVWLYHRARNGIADASAEGPALAVRFATSTSGESGKGEATVPEPTGLPHPKLVRLAPGEEYTEK